MGDSISRRLKSLLTKVREKQPRDDVALTVWIENRDLIYRGLKSKDADTCCTACDVIATMTCEEDAQWIQRAVWDDTGIRSQVVSLMVPAPCPAAVNSLCFVPWQKWAARIIANCASDEETAKEMAQDGQTLNAIICSTSDVRGPEERKNSLEALANLAAVEVNRDQLWANVTLRDHILRAVSPVKQGCSWKPIRLAAFEALWNFAIDGQLCEDMADDEKLLPFWEFCVKRGLSDERRDDKFHSFAQSTLSKMSGVEITGERTKQERDDEKRNAAIDLDEAVAGESSSSPASPPKRRKAQARVEGSQLPTRVAEAARLLAATGEPGPSAPPPSAQPPSAPPPSAPPPSAPPPSAPPPSAPPPSAPPPSAPPPSAPPPSAPPPSAPPLSDQFTQAVSKIKLIFPETASLGHFDAIRHAELACYGKEITGAFLQRAIELAVQLSGDL
eukprot:jgi/Chrpa1/5196/Chrysochromulina_OHIO_Genome00002611-RA